MLKSSTFIFNLTKNMKYSNLFIALFSTLTPFVVAHAEDYAGLSLGYSFSQQLNNLTGNENTNYPGPIDPGSSLYFPGSHLSDVKLDSSLNLGLKYGHWFESYPNLGIEIEGNYSRPDFKRQNVSISSPAIGSTLSAATFGAITQNYITEDQLSAKIKLFQLSSDVMFRFLQNDSLKPYIGGGPTLNILRVTGTGYSGIFVSPDAGTMAGLGFTPGPGPNIAETMVRVGANLKAGVSYNIDKDWDLGAEYKFNWTPMHLSNFRSQSDLQGDFYSQTFSAVLIRRF
jgi:hypothetical protein